VRSAVIKTWSTPVRKEERIPVPCVICEGSLFAPYFTCTEQHLSFGYVRCTHCGLVQVNPQPVPAAVASRYDGSEYLTYEWSNEEAFLGLQELALRDAGFFDLESTTVLDVGCAAGALLAMLKDRGWTVYGVEISGLQAAFCRERGLDVSTLPLEENNFPCQCFDAVLASHVIEHLNNPKSFVREAGRILKSKGRLYITTPNIAGLQGRLFGSRWRSAIFDHLYLFSVRTLRMLLEKEGFTVECVKTWGGMGAGIVPLPVKRLFDALAKPLGFGDVMIFRAVKEQREIPHFKMLPK
jgi:2-polyprenyl-3-methyl-5-hydroxy-6-metoxy-1,4-benzoquinol methylase